MERTVDEVIQAIQAQIDICHQLSSCLDQEEDDLRHSRFETIEQLNKDKSALSKQLEKEYLAQQIIFEQFLKQPPSRDALLSSNHISSPDKQRIITKLDELKALSDSCQFKNEVNGRVLQVNAQINSQIVNILKGVDHSNSVYDASGKIGK